MTREGDRLLHAFHGDDSAPAASQVLVRRGGVDRRGFLGGAGVAAVGTGIGATLALSDAVPGGVISPAMAQGAAPPAGGQAAGGTTSPPPLNFPGKNPALVVLGERPLVAETPEQLLDDETTTIAKFFVRNNGLIPEPVPNPDSWKLVVEGEVNDRLELTLGELKQRFAQKTYRMVLECGGNGRSFFQPQARGNPWTNGGVGCAEWTGVALADVLKAARPKPSAVYTAHYGADPHLSGDPKQDPLSRGVPIAKAMDEMNLIVFAMNGEPLPLIHGGPLRLVIAGWPGSASHKWLNRIVIRDREHDGQGMTGTSYRLPLKPMIPGGRADEKDFRVMESMPVRSVVTSPATGTRLPAGTRDVALRGAAWAGDLSVSKVDVSTDSGQTWSAATLAPIRNRYDWHRWTAAIKLPTDGYYEIWVRATDSNGRMQPPVAAGWNPQGYGGNAMHRISILVG